MPNCLNCNDPWVKGEIYCSKCGQKTKLPNLSFWMLIADFFQNLFNLDAKIWLTLRDIWLPSKITLAYLHGQRVKYYNPIRIFLISLFSCFALILSVMNDRVDEANTFIDQQKLIIEKKDIISRLDSLMLCSDMDTSLVLETKRIIFNKGKSAKIDSSGKLNGYDGLFSFSFGREDKNSFERYLSKNIEELEEEYKDDHPIKRILAIQFQKILLNPGKGIAFLLGNGTWAVILFIMMSSLFFKLIYIRNKYLYVEHVLFHLNGHTRILLLGIFICLLIKYLMYSSWYFLAFYLIGLIYLAISMKRFYKQSWFKTIAKLIMSIVAMFNFTILSIVAILYISLLVF